MNNFKVSSVPLDFPQYCQFRHRQRPSLKDCDEYSTCFNKQTAKYHNTKITVYFKSNYFLYIHHNEASVLPNTEATQATIHNNKRRIFEGRLGASLLVTKNYFYCYELQVGFKFQFPCSRHPTFSNLCTVCCQGFASRAIVRKFLFFI